MRWPRLAWIHVPAVAWGALIEFAGWICPLTPLENYLRARSGSSTYQGEFIAHYILPLLYPTDLTRQHQFWLGGLVLVVNILVYRQLSLRRLSRRRPDHTKP